MTSDSHEPDEGSLRAIWEAASHSLQLIALLEAVRTWSENDLQNVQSAVTQLDELPDLLHSTDAQVEEWSRLIRALREIGSKANRLMHTAQAHNMPVNRAAPLLGQLRRAAETLLDNLIKNVPAAAMAAVDIRNGVDYWGARDLSVPVPGAQ